MLSDIECFNNVVLDLNVKLYPQVKKAVCEKTAALA